MKEAPTFFIGAPRSGTSILFEAFHAHEELACFTQWTTRLAPRLPLAGRVQRLAARLPGYQAGAKARRGRNRFPANLRPRPVEAWDLWNALTGVDIARSTDPERHLTADAAERTREALAEFVAATGRRQFAHKFTGPPRIRLLRTLFPHARFVHIRRDPAATVRSLLAVEFWRDEGGLQAPWWDGLLNEEDLEFLRCNDTPELLALLQCRRIVERTAEEAAELPAGRFREITFEEFLRAPQQTIEDLWAFCELPPTNDPQRLQRTIAQLDRSAAGGTAPEPAREPEPALREATALLQTYLARQGGFAADAQGGLAC